MLRYRAVEARKGKVPFGRAPADQDRPQRHASRSAVAPLANWASRRGNKLTRAAAGEGRRRRRARPTLPKFHGRDLRRARQARAARGQPRGARASAGARRRSTPPASSTTTTRPSAWRRAPCSRITASRPRSSIPRCCGMPQLEHGDIAKVAAERARSRRGARAADRPGLRHRRAGAVLRADAEVRMAADPARRSEGEEAGQGDVRHRRICRRHRQAARPGAGPASRSRAASRVHLACHARAQNMGAKAAEMLRLIPDAEGRR